MKYAVFTMDVEDWYHLDYFLDKKVDKSFTMLDGIDRYLSIINKYDIKSTFFVLSCLADEIKEKIRDISSMGHEIACHGDDHTRPLTIDVNSFKKRTVSAKKKIEELIGVSLSGYRASSFSLDRERLDIIKEIGFLYDSSKNPFDEHPLYGKIDMSGFEKINPNIYRNDNFIEFETSAISMFGKNMPVSGGAYIRVFPWLITQKMIKEYIKEKEFYVFYIHPFEVSRSEIPPLDSSISLTTRMRFSGGRYTVEKKIIKLIKLLKEDGFEFLTFSEMRNNILNNKS